MNLKVGGGKASKSREPRLPSPFTAALKYLLRKNVGGGGMAIPAPGGAGPD